MRLRLLLRTTRQTDSPQAAESRGPAVPLALLCAVLAVHLAPEYDVEPNETTVALAQAGLMEPVGQERIRDLDNQARELYETALARDPDNFQALFAYAIYESYSPKGAARAQALLARLDALRDGHPHYPWAQVDQLRARLTAAK